MHLSGISASISCPWYLFVPDVFYLQGSDEEKKDILQAYEKRKGKMSAVIDSIMLATEGERTENDRSWLLRC